MGLRSSGLDSRTACVPSGSFTASAADQAESRTDLLHGTPRRRCGVDETRDWFRRSPTRRDQLTSGERQYRKRNGCAQEGIFLSPRVNIAHISTRARSLRWEMTDRPSRRWCLAIVREASAPPRAPPLAPLGARQTAPVSSSALANAPAAGHPPPARSPTTDLTEPAVGS